MVNTPNVGIPYPAPGDACDVPGDFKALAERVDVLIDGLVMPRTLRQYKSQNDIQVRQKGGDQAGAVLPGYDLSLTNPSKTFTLRVECRQRCWGRVGQFDYGTGQGDASVALYVEPITTGGTSISYHQARISAENLKGSEKAQPVYTDMYSYRMIEIAPGQSVTMKARAWVSTSNQTILTAFNPLVRFTETLIMPLAWVEASGLSALTSIDEAEPVGTAP